MRNSNFWIRQIAQKLAENSFVALAPETYQPRGYKYVARHTRFEISKLGMAETFYTFAEIPNLTIDVLRQFSNASFRFAKTNKTVPLPCGLFEAVFCFAVAITAHLNQETAEYVRQVAPPKHASAFELPVIFDLVSGELYYFEKTPLWGGAYYAGFRREIQANLG